MIAESWRVADHTPAAPAHLVVVGNPRVVTGCGWVPSQDGIIIDRPEVLKSCRFACRACMSVASGRPLRRAA